MNPHKKIHEVRTEINTPTLSMRKQRHREVEELAHSDTAGK